MVSQRRIATREGFRRFPRFFCKLLFVQFLSLFSTIQSSIFFLRCGSLVPPLYSLFSYVRRTPVEHRLTGSFHFSASWCFCHFTFYFHFFRLAFATRFFCANHDFLLVMSQFFSPVFLTVFRLATAASRSQLFCERTMSFICCFSLVPKLLVFELRRSHVDFVLVFSRTFPFVCYWGQFLLDFHSIFRIAFVASRFRVHS